MYDFQHYRGTDFAVQSSLLRIHNTVCYHHSSVSPFIVLVRKPIEYRLEELIPTLSG